MAPRQEMIKNADHYLRVLNTKIALAESLLQVGNFKQALAEIKELENQKIVDEFSSEAGELSYFGALALDKLGRLNEAVSKAKKAFEILKNTSDNRRVAQVQHIMGIIYAHLGDLKEAELQFIDTASTYRRIDDQKGIIDIYNELARICFMRSDFSRAIEYINDALEYCDRVKDERMMAQLTGNLGTIHMIKDEWQLARENLLKSLELNRLQKNQINACRSLLSLGYVSFLLREFSKAEDYLKQAYRIIYENSFLRELGIYHEYSGELAYLQDDLDEAKKHYLKAIQIGEEIAPKSAIISQAARLLAELQVKSGQLDESLASCERSLQISKSIGEKLEEGAVYRILGQIHSQKGREKEAKENFNRAVKTLGELGVKSELAKTYLEMAGLGCFDFLDKMRFLGRAEELAGELDTPYYLGRVKLAFALLFFESQKHANALSFLCEAKRIFQQTDGTGDLEKVSELEKQIRAVSPAAEGSKVSARQFSFEDIITQDKQMLELIENVQRVKDSDITILLEGETGTGKDLLAKALHHTSNRRNRKFVVANCAALPEGLFESELFGYKKGAFTGASSNKKGLLDEAAGGTLYLDEIAEVPFPVQVKLLRAIEEKEIVRLGEVKPRRVDFRVVAATNRDLEKSVEEGRFRSDLYYRLGVIKFKLPPLRERKEDIPLLVEHFMKKYAAEGGAQVSVFDPKIMKLFFQYDWPGNVRELENDLKSLLAFVRDEDKISFELLADILEKFNHGKSNNHTSLLSQLAQYEREQITRALVKSNWVKTKAARLLNIDEALLRYKIKKHNITPL
jgi:DNA-binding NtrC family response regulator/predicted negative regulator of RcsB-dependent stress response